MSCVAGFHLHMNRKRGRAFLGKRAILRNSPNSRGSNLTVLLAVSPLFGVVHSHVMYGKVSQATFIGFLRDMCLSLASNPNTASCQFTMIMDNVAFHKTDAVKQWFTTYINNNNNLPHRQVTLPVYSPMLNPAENCFSLMKTYVRYHQRQPDCQQVLHELVQAGLRQITPQFVFNAYQHTKTYHRAILNREDIET